MENRPIKKENEQEQTYFLYQNDRFVFEGSHFKCCLKLQQSQSQSANWAMKYEGWEIRETKKPIT